MIFTGEETLFANNRLKQRGVLGRACDMESLFEGWLARLVRLVLVRRAGSDSAGLFHSFLHMFDAIIHPYTAVKAYLFQRLGRVFYFNQLYAETSHPIADCIIHIISQVTELAIP